MKTIYIAAMTAVILLNLWDWDRKGGQTIKELMKRNLKSNLIALGFIHGLMVLAFFIMKYDL